MSNKIKKHTMDHKRIEEEDIIERYLMGELSDQDRNLFENHYFTCDSCFKKVKETEKVILGIRDAAQRGVLKEPAIKRKKFFNIFDWLHFKNLSPAIAFASLLLVLIMIYPAWRGIFVVANLKEEVRRLREPQVISAGFDLGVMRSGERGTTKEILIRSDMLSFTLNFTVLEKSIPSPIYNAEIFDSQKNQVWKGEGLKGQGEYEIFSIICQSAFFEDGDYSLKVYEINPANRQIENEFLFPFRILHE